ncbi:hypothetical protein LPJ66_003037 [Kickxella alabastrina]|uniref:Uncharacterized protein n=1 Tax=Kickxella alabastrina TaxID=61397 RepID=A0ACC1IKZ6_9FUNG|nr:hypothetical protein LPJ66_003037 [Kickxella alabastrina]
MNSRYSTRLLLTAASILFLICSGVFGNTEIRHFRPPAINTDSHFHVHQSEIKHQLSRLIPGQVLLSSPYTSTGTELIASLQSVNSTRQDRERWYCLADLEPNESYELRVSYAATTPADFTIEIFTIDQMAKLHGVAVDAFDANPLESQGNPNTLTSGARLTMYTKVTASYSGVSVVPRMEDRRVPYVFVLEKHVLGLPIQAIKLIAVLVVVIAFSLLWVTPCILAKIKAVLAEETVPPKQD